MIDGSALEVPGLVARYEKLRIRVVGDDVDCDEDRRRPIRAHAHPGTGDRCSYGRGLRGRAHEAAGGRRVLQSSSSGRRRGAGPEKCCRRSLRSHAPTKPGQGLIVIDELNELRSRECILVAGRPSWTLPGLRLQSPFHRSPAPTKERGATPEAKVRRRNRHPTASHPADAVRHSWPTRPVVPRMEWLPTARPADSTDPGAERRARQAQPRAKY